MSTVCGRPQGGRGWFGPCGCMWAGGERGGQKRDFFVDVINGWPLINRSSPVRNYRPPNLWVLRIFSSLASPDSFSPRAVILLLRAEKFLVGRKGRLINLVHTHVHPLNTPLMSFVVDVKTCMDTPDI